MGPKLNHTLSGGAAFASAAKGKLGRMEEKPRIPPGDREQIGPLNAAITWAIGRASGGRAPNVFTTLARNRGLFRRWLFFAGGLMPGGKLPRQDTELVILRVSRNTGCAYEWSHHERLAQRAGFSTEEVERVRSGPEAPGWTPRQQLLLRACDEMHADGAIGEETWSHLAAELDDRLLIELCLLIGHYEMLAMTINSLRVQLDPPSKRIA